MLKSVWIMTCVILASSATSSQNKANLSSRRRRYLAFPPSTSIAELVVGFGMPLLIHDHSLTIGTIVKFVYGVPRNGTPYTDAVFPKEKRLAKRTTRWDVYSMLEAASDRLGLSGRACVLRAICEASDTTLHHSGIAGEILHVLLTPSTTSEEVHQYSDQEYHAAEYLGRKQEAVCHLLYPECEVGLLDFISSVESENV